MFSEPDRTSRSDRFAREPGTSAVRLARTASQWNREKT
ncbi:hypothetical protein A2U01_0104170, partial [Trifolium medium]|nr:hypothetical protein [Trifolium medium]